ncbi:hypothetical protein TG4357_01674 [Thalassovita gelatinovora]|uniref:Uncharacterized protein n=1 Tax=Thalassovita gelatinovora TaxID=53501 RepID=A0A0P1FAG8_THAGE|nr:hypothetical protein TG4357_01674 [Thalassovita gelatinovora]
MLVPFRLTDVGEIVLLNSGRAASTVRVAFAIFAGPRLDVRVSVKLVWEPAVTPLMLTVIVQLAPAARLPPEKLIVPPPPGAVSVGGTVRPEHVVTASGEAAISSPAVNVSVNAMSSAVDDVVVLEIV